VYVFYRNPHLFDLPKPKGQTWWFVAQDVDYEGLWTDERLAKVDRYITLCDTHSSYTLTKYPSLLGRVYQSSNGIRSAMIRHLPAVKRDPNALFFPSSPDRGVKFLLEQWFRVREINPKATLRVAYGFDNMDKIVQFNGMSDWRYQYQRDLRLLSRQDGVTFTGRLTQAQLYDEWLHTQAWSHPTDFPETSCITSMEAQALGAWPVTNDLWALRDNVQHGYVVTGIPQQSDLVRTQWLHALEMAFHNHNETARREMSEWALERFDWERVATQWENWLKEDV
jgi:glycosyltransferase involved in cell wall biosynthesis